MKRLTPHFLIALGILFSSLACYFMIASVWKTETTSQQYPAAELRALAVDSENGAIKVTGVPDAKEVSVTVTKKAGAATDAEADACMKAIELTRATDGITLRLGWKWAQPKKRGWQASVDFEIMAPAGSSVTAMSRNGRIEVERMAGPVVMKTSNGELVATAIGGSLAARSSNGRIRAEDIGGLIEARTGNGQINVECQSPRVRLETGNGAIDADLRATGALDGRINTGNGAVTLRLGEGVSARVECRTKNGALNIEGNIEKVKQTKGEYVGRVGSGDGRLEIETGNGAITVTR